jgi:hypothetical protein
VANEQLVFLLHERWKRGIRSSHSQGVDSHDTIKMIHSPLECSQLSLLTAGCDADGVKLLKHR